jgi:thiamine biosynthesis lipoprotein
MVAVAPLIHSKNLKLMGNRFEFTVVSDDAVRAQAVMDDAVAEVQRIEKLLTTFNEASQTNRVNAAAGIHPVEVDQEVFDLIERSLKISVLTQGAFDITYGSIDKRLWNFDQTMTALPDQATAKAMVRLINYKSVVLNKTKRTVYLKEKGMRIGFGGIGKGYAADCAKKVMKKAGVEHGIVNAAGDLTVWGNQPDGSPWTIGIADPDKRLLPFGSVQITNVSVATSGNYEKFVMIGGVRYSHTIDPKTGYPVRGIKSATIICPTAELADAMATPVMVMGVEAGLSLINQLIGFAGIVIDDNDRVFTSKNINLKPV